MNFFLEKNSHFIALTMLFITLLSNFFQLNYTIAGNMIGYSIFTNIYIYLWYNCRKNVKYCFFSRNVWVAFCLINILNILGFYFIDYIFYIRLSNILVCSVSIFLFLIYVINISLTDSK